MASGSSSVRKSLLAFSEGARLLTRASQKNTLAFGDAVNVRIGAVDEVVARYGGGSGDAFVEMVGGD